MVPRYVYTNIREANEPTKGVRHPKVWLKQGAVKSWL